MSKNGFTLIEILVVVSIIALLSVVAIPNFRSFQKKQTVQNYAKSLAASLKLAQDNTRTGTKCPDPNNVYTAAKEWDVVYSANSTTETIPPYVDSFYMRAGCYNPNGTYNLSYNPGLGPGTGNWTQMNIPNSSVYLPSGITIRAASCNNQWGSDAMDFNLTYITTDCGSDPWPYIFTVSDGQNTSHVKVDKGGNITVY